MGRPILDHFCCCCSLHIGTLVIGCVFTILSALSLIACCLVVTLWPLGGTQVYAYKFIFYIAVAVVNGVHILASILLVVAAIKKIPWLLLPWAILSGIIAAIYFIVSLTAISLILQDTTKTLDRDIPFAIAFTALSCISIYSVVVVHSRHKELLYQKREHFARSSLLSYKRDTGVENVPLNVI